MFNQEFYDKWAQIQSKSPFRETILKWKAVNLANLFLRTLKDQAVHHICEIGGAEGTVVNHVGYLLDAKEMINYEPSTEFCKLGASIYPDVAFINTEFRGQETKFDLIILSDILEHIGNEKNFLRNVSQSCQFALFKIPIEKCLTQMDFVYWMRGRKKPPELQFGAEHMNGHLRGYTRQEGLKSVSRFFHILDTQSVEVTWFYKSRTAAMMKRWFGTGLGILFFGGALFVLGKSKALGGTWDGDTKP